MFRRLKGLCVGFLVLAQSCAAFAALEACRFVEVRKAYADGSFSKALSVGSFFQPGSPVLQAAEKEGVLHWNMWQVVGSGEEQTPLMLSFPGQDLFWNNMNPSNPDELTAVFRQYSDVRKQASMLSLFDAGVGVRLRNGLGFDLAALEDPEGNLLLAYNKAEEGSTEFDGDNFAFFDANSKERCSVSDLLEAAKVTTFENVKALFVAENAEEATTAAEEATAVSAEVATEDEAQAEDEGEEESAAAEEEAMEE